MHIINVFLAPVGPVWLNASMPRRSTPNPAEIAQFEALAEEWWDVDGPMAPLHAMNPTRLRYIRDQLQKNYDKIDGRTVLDVGCGGGPLAEPLTRWGMHVTAIDGAHDLIAIAKDRATKQQLDITYKHATTADLLRSRERFDVVVASEVIEHVDAQAPFVAELAQLTKPGGLVILSTLNRTVSSYAVAIVAAEKILRVLPRGTHRWKNFVKPSELWRWATEAGLEPVDMCGMVYHPARREFTLDAQRLSVNYIFTARKR